MNRQLKKITSNLNTPKQVQERLICGPSKFYSLINSGELPAVKMGNNTFVTDEAIDEYIDNLPAYPLEPALRKRQRKTAA